MSAKYVIIFVYVLVLSVAQVILYRLAERFPTLTWSATVLAGLSALFGAIVVATAGIMALTIATSADDANRRGNLAACLRLGGIGVLAMVPLAICILLTVLP